MASASRLVYTIKPASDAYQDYLDSWRVLVATAIVEAGQPLTRMTIPRTSCVVRGELPEVLIRELTESGYVVTPTVESVTVVDTQRVTSTRIAWGPDAVGVALRDTTD